MAASNFSPVPTQTAAVVLLRGKGIVPTRPRIEIAQLLFARPQHISADAVAAGLSRAGSTISRATVYNTLGLFVEKGLLRAIMADPTRLFYDSNTAPHYHLFDVETGRIEDLGGEEAALSVLANLPPGVQVESVDVVVRVRGMNPTH